VDTSSTGVAVNGLQTASRLTSQGRDAVHKGGGIMTDQNVL